MHIINMVKKVIGTCLGKSENSFLRRSYWNMRARDIHETWGRGTDDFQVLREVIELVKPQRILDLGCGSGRCFPLYKEMNIPEVVGQDVSSRALDICKNRFPELPYRLIKKDIRNMDFSVNYFDLIISTRVLAAVIPKDISPAVKHLCKISRFIYMNEMTDSDYAGPSDYWFKHDYEKMMQENNFSLAQKGTIAIIENGKTYVQAWALYKKG